jgi:4-diphosphocytidyl-2-C-methyl-D-erythritol kinase
VVSPLDFGDELTAEAVATDHPAGGRFSLMCDDPALAVDGSNLILRAAELFAAATGWKGGVCFKLTKRIPVGAGLGGGSSNAVAALRAMNELAGGLADTGQLAALASELGSDCPLFLRNAPVIMRGRGERVELLADVVAQRLRGRQVLLFKPTFGVSTAWAYGRMAAAGVAYLPERAAEERLVEWCAGGTPAGNLLFNNMEGVVFDKFAALPALREKLRKETGVSVQMSGSGSACFALPGDDRVTAALETRIRECWGPAAFVQRARLAWSSALTASRGGAFNSRTS